MHVQPQKEHKCITTSYIWDLWEIEYDLENELKWPQSFSLMDQPQSCNVFEIKKLDSPFRRQCFTLAQSTHITGLKYYKVFTKHTWNIYSGPWQNTVESQSLRPFWKWGFKIPFKSEYIHVRIKQNKKVSLVLKKQ